MLTFALLFILWCALHSLLATDACKDFCFRRGIPKHVYRLGYNIIALITFAPLVHLYINERGAMTYWLPFPARIAQVIGIVLALGIGAAALRCYDWLEFIGLKSPVTSVFHRHGILGRIRHPLYVSSILLLWSRELRGVDFLLNSLATLYFILGAHLEERRLLREFGEDYRQYQRKVPMFIPRLFRHKSRNSH